MYVHMCNVLSTDSRTVSVDATPVHTHTAQPTAIVVDDHCVDITMTLLPPPPAPTFGKSLPHP